MLSGKQGGPFIGYQGHPVGRLCCRRSCWGDRWWREPLPTPKGDWGQFIRYIVAVVALPIAATLAFQGMLTEAAVSLVLGVLGFLFPTAGKD